MKIEDIEVYDEDRNEFGETPLMKAYPKWIGHVNVAQCEI
jgi:hypothetical protein